MKKTIIFLLLSLLTITIFIACNDDLTDTSSSFKIDDCQTVSPYYVSYDSALAIALRQLSTNEIGTRATKSRIVKEHYFYSPSPLTRNSASDVPEFHVFNFADNKGFAIVSSDRRTTPVYAYSAEGNIDIENAVAKTGVREFMECAKDYYREEIEQFNRGPGPLDPIEPDSSLIDLMTQIPVIIDGIECVQRQIITYDNQGYLMTTKWHQLDPYNYFCPTYVDNNGVTRKTYVGCGPTAMGQIMAYHSYPPSYSNYTFDWDSICSLSNTFSSDTCKARLVRIVGIVSNATYNPDGTSTTISDIRNAFQQMGYQTSQVTNNGNSTIQDIKSGIQVHKPLYFRGSSFYSNGGHAWVVDGYNSTKYQTVYYYAYFPYPEYKTVTNSETIYYHCNFGWGDSGTGYYLNVYENEFGNNIKYLHMISPNI